MADRPELTVYILRQYVTYDPETGEFTWNIRPIRPGYEKWDRLWNKRYGGQKVKGFVHRHGHIQFGFGEYGAHIMAHRLAWLYVYGQWPTMHLDHINGDPADNRIANLRLATSAQNMANCKIPITNKSGFTGVHWVANRRKWCARISHNDKTLYLGIFAKKEEAVAARKAAEEKYFGEFARRAVIS